MELNRPTSPVITYGTYPLLLLIGVALTVVTLERGLDRAMVPALYGPLTAIILILLEWRHPLRAEWRMTKRSFWRRDAKYLLATIVIAQISQAASIYVAARLVPDASTGPLAQLPIWAQVAVSLLIFDSLWYVYHRAAHRGGWLWRSHGAHHSPPQLYTLMHLVFHPIDNFFIQFVLMTAAFGLSGVSPVAALIALMLIALQPTVSHANLDLRVGPLNYLLIGTELHRFHHSASPEDAGNFGTVLSVWDQVFGSFVYRPRQIPASIGLTDPTGYPNPERFHAVLAWPFLAGARPTVNQVVSPVI